MSQNLTIAQKVALVNNSFNLAEEIVNELLDNLLRRLGYTFEGVKITLETDNWEAGTVSSISLLAIESNDHTVNFSIEEDPEENCLLITDIALFSEEEASQLFDMLAFFLLRQADEPSPDRGVLQKDPVGKLVYVMA